jgi:hypothetical protein
VKSKNGESTAKACSLDLRTKFSGQKQIKNLIFVDKAGINHQHIEESAWSEREIKVFGERSQKAYWGLARMKYFSF